MEKNTPEDLFKKMLLQLAKENRLKNLTVVDLVNKSGLSRQTFYRYFYNIDDLIYSVHRDIVKPAHKSMEQLNDSFLFLDLYVRLMDNYRFYYKQIISFNPHTPFVDKYINETKIRMLKYTFNTNTHEILESQRLYFAYTFYYVGFCITLLEWLKNDNNITANELYISYRKLIPESLVPYLSTK
ncbi:MAG: TetR/AcrR family transcriptional regulator [Lagierella massiliensis]|nr:TetR/AcrR family transcriptional regulator [Lagierella massiliensis]